MQGLVERVRACVHACMCPCLSVSPVLQQRHTSALPPALLPPQARQALGPDAFLPCTLEAQEQTLRELDILAPNLQDMLKAAQVFAGDTNSTPCCNTLHHKCGKH